MSFLLGGAYWQDSLPFSPFLPHYLRVVVVVCMCVCVECMSDVICTIDDDLFQAAVLTVQVPPIICVKWVSVI